MKKLDEIGDKFYDPTGVGIGIPDEDWWLGWKAAHDLNLPIKFAYWLGEVLHNNYYWAEPDGNVKDFNDDSVEKIFEYWIEKIYKPE